MSQQSFDSDTSGKAATEREERIQAALRSITPPPSYEDAVGGGGKYSPISPQASPPPSPLLPSTQAMNEEEEEVEILQAPPQTPVLDALALSTAAGVFRDGNFFYDF